MKFIGIKEVVKKTGVSRATIYRLVKAGKFPSFVKLQILEGSRSVFVEEEIEAWMESRIAERDGNNLIDQKSSGGSYTSAS